MAENNLTESFESWAKDSHEFAKRLKEHDKDIKEMKQELTQLENSISSESEQGSGVAQS